MSKRDYYDKFYAKFRQDVRKRDSRRCKWPACGKKKRLQVHHILPWKMFPHLRYKVENGITLCKAHHQMVTGNEITFAKFLSSLLVK